VDAGASVLRDERASVERRRAIDAAYDERGEGEARADVARREDQRRRGDS